MSQHQEELFEDHLILDDAISDWNGFDNPEESNEVFSTNNRLAVSPDPQEKEVTNSSSMQILADLPIGTPLRQVMRENLIERRILSTLYKAGMRTLGEVLAYYREHETFTNISGIGRESNSRLEEICKHLLSPTTTSREEAIFPEVDQRVKGRSIEELAVWEGWSVRARNGIEKEGLRTIGDFILFREEAGTFGHLPKIGTKTAEELEQTYQHLLTGSLSLNVPVELPRPGILSEEVERKLVGEFAIVSRSLSVRASSGVERLRDLRGKEGDVDRYPFLYWFSSQRLHDFAKISGVGLEAATELDSLGKRLRKYLEVEGKSASRFTQIQKIWHEVYRLAEEEGEAYHQAFTTNTFPLFSFIDRLLREERILDERGRALLERRLAIRERSQPEKLEEIGADFGLTRERVRQITVTLPDHIASAIGINGLLLERTAYGINPFSTDALIVIDPEFAQWVNQQEGTNFTPHFIAIVIRALLERDYDPLPVPGYNDLMTSSLIRSELRETVAIEDYLNDFSKRLKRVVPQRQVLDLHKELVPYIKGELSTEDYEKVVRGIAHAISVAFDLDLDETGGIILERTAKVQTHEMAVEVLEETGEPLHVMEIFQRINERYPDAVAHHESLRSVLVRYDIFASYGRNSIWGLRKWDNEFQKFRSGTYSDLAEEYLQLEEKPCSTFEVVKYIQQWRDAQASSILYTLEADGAGRFIIEDGMVRLARWQAKEPEEVMQKGKEEKESMTGVKNEERRSIEDYEVEEILWTIRQLFSDGRGRTRDGAIIEITGLLGFGRTGTRIRKALESMVERALDRGIIVLNEGMYKIGCREIDHYPPERLKGYILVAIGREWNNREEVVGATARYLGFKQTGENIRHQVLLLIARLVREGALEEDEKQRVRKLQEHS